MQQMTKWKKKLLFLTMILMSVSFRLVAMDVIDLKNGWFEVKPGGETICARGGEYSFFYYKGKSDKVVLDFIGGGACWDEETCKNNAVFYDSVDDLRDRVNEGLTGIYDHTNTNNPIREWSHVVIPYCTGDIHWGDSVVTYGAGEQAITIHHKGAVNAKSVLNWMGMNIKAPNELVVTGCSAGSYGSIYWTPYVKELYPRTRIAQLGDSGVGVVTEAFFRNHFKKWNPEKNAPRWIPEMDPERVDWFKLKSPDMYEAVARHYPDVRLSQFTSAFDSNQIFYYELMGGGDEEEWSKEMFSYLTRIDTKSPNFSYYIGGGQNHCIIPYDEFYHMKTQDVKFIDWFNKFISWEASNSVRCEGRECDPLN